MGETKVNELINSSKSVLIVVSIQCWVRLVHKIQKIQKLLQNPKKLKYFSQNSKNSNNFENLKIFLFCYKAFVD